MASNISSVALRPINGSLEEGEEEMNPTVELAIPPASPCWRIVPVVAGTLAVFTYAFLASATDPCCSDSLQRAKYTGFAALGMVGVALVGTCVRAVMVTSRRTREVAVAVLNQSVFNFRKDEGVIANTIVAVLPPQAWFCFLFSCRRRPGDKCPSLDFRD